MGKILYEGNAYQKQLKDCFEKVSLDMIAEQNGYTWRIFRMQEEPGRPPSFLPARLYARIRQ